MYRYLLVLHRSCRAVIRAACSKMYVTVYIHIRIVLVYYSKTGYMYNCRILDLVGEDDATLAWVPMGDLDWTFSAWGGVQKYLYARFA